MADLKVKQPRRAAPKLRGHSPRGTIGAPDMFLYIEHPEPQTGHLPGCPRVLTVEVTGSGMANRDGVRWHSLDARCKESCACCGSPAGASGWCFLQNENGVYSARHSAWVFMCASCVEVVTAPDAIPVRPYT